jgi:O-glycosyl hydrolase
MLEERRKSGNGSHDASATCIVLKDGLSVSYSFDHCIYGLFMKFVKRGAVRVDSSGGDRFFENVAFLNPDGALILVVANGGRQEKAFAVSCGGKSFAATLGPRSVATCCWTP